MEGNATIWVLETYLTKYTNHDTKCLTFEEDGELTQAGDGDDDGGAKWGKER